MSIIIVIYGTHSVIIEELVKEQKQLSLNKINDIQTVNYINDSPSITIPDEFLLKAHKSSKGQISIDNIVNYILYFEGDYYKDKIIESTYKILGLFMSEIRKHDFSKMTVDEIFIAISKTIDDVLNLEFSDNANHLSYSIIQKITDCDINSFLFLMIAHELHYPIHAVSVPGHIFVRWDDGKIRRNFETTDKTFPSDGDIMNKFNIDSYSMRNNSYLKNMTSDEIISLVCFNIGYSYFEENNENTEIVLKYGLKLTPYNQNLLVLLSHYYMYVTQEYEKSLQYLNKAFEGDAGNQKYFVFKSDLYSEMGDYFKAIDTLMYAYLMNPTNPVTLWNLGWYYYKVGNLEYAITYSEESIKNDYSSFEIFLNLGLYYQLSGNVNKSNYYYKIAFLKGSNTEVLEAALTDLHEALYSNIYSDRKKLIKNRISLIETKEILRNNQSMLYLP